MAILRALPWQWSLDRLAEDLHDLVARADLIVANGDKAVPPSSSQEATTMLPNAHLLSVKNLGHLAHEEDPNQILDPIEQALQAA